MSYELVVFDPSTAPAADNDLLERHESVIAWMEQRNCTSPAPLAGNLRTFYDRLRHIFPPMDGPDGATDEEVEEDEDNAAGSWLTGYAFAEGLIRLDIAWSVADQARGDVQQLAQELGLGVVFRTDANLIVRPG